MDRNEENAQNVSFRTKLNAKIDRIRKTTIRAKIMSVALALVVIIVFVSIFFPLKQDPDTFTDPVKRSTWISNTVIACSLSIIGLILCENIFTDKLKGKEGGKYQNAKVGYEKYDRDGRIVHEEGYLDKRTKVKQYERNFPDWFDWYCANELKRKKISAIGTDDAEAVLAHIDEIGNPLLLCDHIEVTKKHWWSRPVHEEVKGIPLKMKDGTFIDVKTPEEVRGIEKVKDGEIRIFPYEAPYYLSLDAVPINVSQVDKAYILNKAKNENMVFQRTFKIVMGIIVAVYWAMVTVDDFSNLGNANAWLLLIIRLGTLMGGVISGWSGADMAVKFDIDMINDRSAVLDSFYDDMAGGRFSEEEYRRRLRKEAEERHGEEGSTADGETPQAHVVEESSGDSGQSNAGRMVG